MSTAIETKPCFYCYHPVDMKNDPHIKFEAMHNMPNIFTEGAKVVAHELCAAEADEEDRRGKAYMDALDDQFDCPLQQLSDLYPVYYEVLDGD